MLRVTIELDQFGLGTNKKVLRTMNIINTGTGTRSLGNYRIEFIGEGGNVYKKTLLSGFPRLQLGPWRLVEEALKKYKEPSWEEEVFAAFRQEKS